MPRQHITKNPDYIKLIKEIMLLENYELSPVDNALSYMWKLQKKTEWEYSNLYHKIETLAKKGNEFITIAKEISVLNKETIVKIKINWDGWGVFFLEEYVLPTTKVSVAKESIIESLSPVLSSPDSLSLLGRLIRDFTLPIIKSDVSRITTINDVMNEFLATLAQCSGSKDYSVLIPEGYTKKEEAALIGLMGYAWKTFFLDERRPCFALGSPEIQKRKKK